MNYNKYVTEIEKIREDYDRSCQGGSFHYEYKVYREKMWRILERVGEEYMMEKLKGKIQCKPLPGEVIFQKAKKREG